MIRESLDWATQRAIWFALLKMGGCGYRLPEPHGLPEYWPFRKHYPIGRRIALDVRPAVTVFSRAVNYRTKPQLLLKAMMKQRSRK